MEKMSPKIKQTRLCYVLPDYDTEIGSHFFHIYELLEKTSDKLDIFVFVERSTDWPKRVPFRWYVQKFSWPPFRFAEICIILLRERINGTKNFYTHYSYYGAVAGWVAAFFGGQSFYWNCGMPWLYKRGRLEEWIFRFAMRKNILVTGTESLRKEYAQRYGLNGQKTRVFPNWINLKRFGSGFGRKEEAKSELGFLQDEKIVLFVHHLSERKGSDVLPDIIEGFKDEENIKFVVVGDGPEEERFAREIKKRGLDKITLTKGKQANRMIPFYFWASDIFLMPSEEEGFPRVLLEAMASGVPFVASDAGGVRDFVPTEAKEFLCSPKDTECFVKNLKTLFSEKALYDRLSESELEKVKEFNLPEVLDRFVALFD